jgi:hypothetical protein
MAPLADANGFEDQDCLVRSREPVEVKAAVVVAILGDAAEAEPLLDVVAAPDGFAGRDVQQEARAIGQ